MGHTKAVFTLGLDYDRIIIELNMKSVPDYNWITIASNNPKGVV